MRITTLTRTRYMHWLSNHRTLFIIAVVSLATLISIPELRTVRSAKVVAFFATRLVTTGGTDAGDCTGAPCKTINYAIGQAMAGDTISVGPGTYIEDVDINKSLNLKSVSGAAVTTIRGAGHCLPTSCPGGPISALTLSAPGITLDGFKITTTNPASSLITADGSTNSKNHVIKNNVITNPTFDDGNAGGGWGILLGYGDADNNQILNNDISLNPDREKNQFTFGFWAQGGGSDNNVISGNNIHDLGTAIITDELDNDTDILNNTFANLARRGVVVFGSTNTEIINNTISNAGTAGIQVRLGATNTTIKSNFITLSGVAPITGQTPQGGVFVSDADGGTVMVVNVNFNRLIGNVPAAVNNISGAAVNAVNNWWGCNFGPGVGGGGCMGTPNGVSNTGGGSVVFTPWLKLGITAVPNSITVGGNSNLTADLTVNSANANTSGSGNIPNGTPAAFAGTLGTVAPTNTTTTSGLALSTFTATTIGIGSASTTVDGQTVSAPIIIAGFNSTIADPLICTGPNNTLNVHAVLVNPNNNPAGFSFNAPILAPLSGVPGTCVSSLGNCTITNNAVTVTGTIPAMQSVIVDYKVLVANGTPPGTNLCITSTGRLDIDNNGVFDTNDMVTACTLLNCPPNQPANTAVSGQKPGSVLVFPYYTSNSALLNDTRLSISNVGTQQAIVHIFFIDGTSCQQSDLFLCLTPNASFAFRTLEYDPETTGWLLAVAVNASGIPIQNNSLIGNAFVRDGEYVDNYGAETFAANSPAVAAIGNGVATLFFDGGGYDAAPSQFAVEIQSPLDAAGQQIVTVGLSGNLLTSQMSGAGQVGTGLAFNEKEVFGSFNNWLLGACQARAIISTTSPRIPGGLGNLIKSGQAGTLKFSVGAAVGLIMTPRTATWKGIRALHKTARTTSTITIPVITPVC